jgi:DNA modification methylase
MTTTAPKIALRKLADLQPDPNNARTHSPEQVQQIVESIRTFGWTNPILADELIRAGHGRTMAAKLIYDSGGSIWLAPGEAAGGQKLPAGTVPVIDCTGWDEAQRRAYALADNQLALNAGWDEDILRQELGAISGMDFEIAVIGFDTRALDALMKPSQQSLFDEDPPEPPEDPVSRDGDMWILGGHRLICGSSTDPETVARVLDGEKPHLMVTDPPYGVEYDASWREGSGLNRRGAATGKVLNDDRADWREAWDLFPGDVAYVWHAGAHATEVDQSLQASGFEIRSQIIWAKNQFAIGRGDYHWQHEPCWYAVRKGRKGHYNGDRKQSTVWNIDKPHQSETGHSTQKPLECMMRPMHNNSKRGQVVYEPFSGSGTTIIAGEQIGRRVLAVELNPAYVDVAVLRWEKATGQLAVLEGTDQTFAQVRDARAAEQEPAEAA